jgi:ribonuclease H2 subunit B
VVPATKTQAKVDNKTKGIEKKRKGTKSSQAVEKLKKVNTTGMAKLSSFFNKA